MPLNLSIKSTGSLSYANLLPANAQFLPQASVISIYATCDLNAATDVVSISLQANQGGATQTPISPGYNVSEAEGVNQGPVIPDDVVLSQYGLAAQSALILSALATAISDVLRIKIFILP